MPAEGLPEVRPLSGESAFEAIASSYGKRGRHGHGIARRYLDIGLNGQSLPIHERVYALVECTPRPLRYRVLARLGVHHITSGSATVPLPLQLKYPVRQASAHYIYELPEARPYVHAVTRSRAMQRFSSFDLSSAFQVPAESAVALVHDTLTDSSTSTGACTPEVSVSLVSELRVEAAVQSPCPTVVSILEVVFPDWRVWIDDAPAPLALVDAGFVGARVPSGTHRLRFEYVPLSVRWQKISLGCFISLLGLLIAGLVVQRRRRPR